MHKVLVVDDSIVSHAMLGNMLAKTNFEICGAAKNAAEALEKYQVLSPDIVTMDMNLPDADGMECSRRILRVNPKAKILMISAMRDANLMVQGRAIGISSFLQKPVQANELIDTLTLLSQDDSSAIANMEASYVRPFMQALQKNLFSLAGLHSKISIEQSDEAFLTINGIAVIIGLTGNARGRFVLYTDADTMMKFSRLMLGMEESAPLSDKKANDSIEEAANIIAGYGVSAINDTFQDKTLRITPPGTIFGKNIRIASPRLTSFHVAAQTPIGAFQMNLGFAGGE